MTRLARTASALGLAIGSALAGCSAGDAPGHLEALGDRRYAVELAAPSQLRVGEDGAIDVRIRPKGNRKLSLEFPTRVRFEASSALRVPSQIDKHEATLLTEPAIDFRVPVSGLRTGTTDLEGELRVGVCTGDLCEPVDLAFAIRVQGLP